MLSVVEDEVKESTEQRKADERLDEDVPVINDESTPARDDVITNTRAGESDSDDVVSESESEADSDGTSTDIDDLTFDLNDTPSEEIVHDWGEVARGGEVPHADETSRRLAVCNMDWDRISANDIYGEFRKDMPQEFC